MGRKLVSSDSVNNEKNNKGKAVAIGLTSVLLCVAVGSGVVIYRKSQEPKPAPPVVIDEKAFTHDDVMNLHDDTSSYTGDYSDEFDTYGINLTQGFQSDDELVAFEAERGDSTKNGNFMWADPDSKKNVFTDTNSQMIVDDTGFQENFEEDAASINDYANMLATVEDPVDPTLAIDKNQTLHAYVTKDFYETHDGASLQYITNENGDMTSLMWTCTNPDAADVCFDNNKVAYSDNKDANLLHDVLQNLGKPSAVQVVNNRGDMNQITMNYENGDYSYIVVLQDYYMDIETGEQIPVGDLYVANIMGGTSGKLEEIHNLGHHLGFHHD